MPQDVSCSRCAETRPGVGRVFLPAHLETMVREHVCADCWQLWIEEQTKLINELRLDVSKPEAHELLAQHMTWFLKLPGAKEPARKIPLPPEAEGRD